MSQGQGTSVPYSHLLHHRARVPRMGKVPVVLAQSPRQQHLAVGKHVSSQPANALHSSSHRELPCAALQHLEPPERSGPGRGPQPWPPLRAAPLALLPSHVLRQAFVWLSHSMVEIRPVPKLDIGSKRAKQRMREKGKHEHLLPSSRYQPLIRQRHS